MKYLDELKDQFLKRFKQAFNLGRHGTTKPKDEVWEKYKDLAESIFNSSCMTLNETGDLYPIFFLVRDKVTTPIILHPDSEKMISLETYASHAINIADEQDADALFFISEQWMVKRDMDDEDVKDFETGRKAPSLDPDRQEIVCLIFAEKNGKVKTLMGEIERLPDNTPFVRDSKWSTPDDVTKNFLGPWGQQYGGEKDSTRKKR